MGFEHASGAPATTGAGRPQDAAATAPDTPPVISLTGVRKTYGTGENAVEALKGVDFAAHPNRMTAIVGPSGSGKSTLLNLIGALDTPTSGRISFGGEDLTGMSEAERTKFRARNIGFVFQFLNLLPGLSCEQNVMLGGVIVGMKPREARRRAGELLEVVGLGDKRRQPVRKLSGGQMQRVAIARALINDAPLLLADEPTGNLDEKNAEEITALLHGRATDGRAVVLVTHNNDLAERYADDVMVVRGGLIHELQTAELRELPPAGAGGNPPAAGAPAAAPPADAVAEEQAGERPAQRSPATRIALDPAAGTDELIAEVAMALARRGGEVRLRQALDGRVEIELEGD
jgi:ABC-type lipoprotein export system ATPase subunit